MQRKGKNREGMHLSGQLRHDSRVHNGVIQCKTVGIFSGINLDLISRAAGEEPTEDGTTNGGLGSGAPRRRSGIGPDQRGTASPNGSPISRTKDSDYDSSMRRRIENATNSRTNPAGYQSTRAWRRGGRQQHCFPRDEEDAINRDQPGQRGTGRPLRLLRPSSVEEEEERALLGGVVIGLE
jgi:hypothetical protein